MTQPNISAKIHLHSVNPDGVELVTAILRYPRFIHSELMTHRAFSRNAASSRAIPVQKMINAVQTSPAHPEFWGKNEPGMQASNATDLAEESELAWGEAVASAVGVATQLNTLGLHKQIVNRVLEPFSHITTLVTATDAGLRHFFGLRAHPAAQPEFQVLAYRLLDKYLKSVPTKVGWGEWHLPFGDKIPEEYSTVNKLKISVARAARLSYETHDGEINAAKDIALYDRLNPSDEDEPVHASAFEHAAQADQYIGPDQLSNFDVGYLNRSSFVYDETSGWLQYRKTIRREFKPLTKPELDTRLKNKPTWISL